MWSSVCVTIVTYNSEKFIETCLRSVLAQDYDPLDVIVVDNCSLDYTPRILARFKDQIRVIYNDRNIGFAAAQNQAIAAGSSDWVLALNPDASLVPDFVSRLVAAGGSDDKVGTVCGRLLSMRRDMKRTEPPLIDSTGIYFTPNVRHFDRGWHEPDDGRFRQMEYVFGASAAAALYRREMIEDISIAGEFFDSDFFVYREDADVAWRAQLLGWRCLYVPDAVGYHVRSLIPGDRRSVSAAVNMHSVKNRFLMRIKNATGGLYRKHWIPATARDLLVAGGCLFWEFKSLPAFWEFLKCLPRALEARRTIMSRRRITDEEMAHWFSTKPSTQPVTQVREPVESFE
ncbi:MAG TPA: glycosyltransferase family 2 protein [Bryobacteraceae bacterium]|nr:glycosyltransferase family 2 protein [Bryobacteraceae bacterium]